MRVVSFNEPVYDVVQKDDYSRQANNSAYHCKASKLSSGKYQYQIEEPKSNASTENYNQCADDMLTHDSPLFVRSSNVACYVMLHNQGQHDKANNITNPFYGQHPLQNMYHAGFPSMSGN